ncbi:MAG: hypothetical protein Tsb0014_34890 [Pleurocapsa sp.]
MRVTRINAKAVKYIPILKTSSSILVLEYNAIAVTNKAANESASILLSSKLFF